MTRARLSSARGSVAKIAVAGVLLGIPVVAVSIPAVAAAGGAPTVLPAPLPAEPPTTAPEPPHHPAPPHTTYAETEDWWGYGMDAGGGGGGGG